MNIFDGRKAFYQWDTNQKIRLNAPCQELHIGRGGDETTTDVKVLDSGGDYYAKVPDEILQDAAPFNAYGYVTTPDGNYTRVRQRFAVIAREKPAGYIYTPTERETWAQLQAQIGDLSNLTTEDKTSLVAAINEAAQTGGGAASFVALENLDNISAITDNYPAGTVFLVGLSSLLDEIWNDYVHIDGRTPFWVQYVSAADGSNPAAIFVIEDSAGITVGCQFNTVNVPQTLSAAYVVSRMNFECILGYRISQGRGEYYIRGYTNEQLQMIYAADYPYNFPVRNDSDRMLVSANYETEYGFPTAFMLLDDLEFSSNSMTFHVYAVDTESLKDPSGSPIYTKSKTITVPATIT